MIYFSPSILGYPKKSRIHVLSRKEHELNYLNILSVYNVFSNKKIKTSLRYSVSVNNIMYWGMWRGKFFLKCTLKKN